MPLNGTGATAEAALVDLLQRGVDSAHYEQMRKFGWPNIVAEVDAVTGTGTGAVTDSEAVTRARAFIHSAEYQAREAELVSILVLEIDCLKHDKARIIKQLEGVVNRLQQ